MVWLDPHWDTRECSVSWGHHQLDARLASIPHFRSWLMDLLERRIQPGRSYRELTRKGDPRRSENSLRTNRRPLHIRQGSTLHSRRAPQARNKIHPRLKTSAPDSELWTSLFFLSCQISKAARIALPWFIRLQHLARREIQVHQSSEFGLRRLFYLNMSELEKPSKGRLDSYTTLPFIVNSSVSTNDCQSFASEALCRSFTWTSLISSNLSWSEISSRSILFDFCFLRKPIFPLPLKIFCRIS